MQTQTLLHLQPIWPKIMHDEEQDCNRNLESAENRILALLHHELPDKQASRDPFNITVLLIPYYRSSLWEKIL